jgi:AAA+ superfamily predicted ATPase
MISMNIQAMELDYAKNQKDEEENDLQYDLAMHARLDYDLKVKQQKDEFDESLAELFFKQCPEDIKLILSQSSDDARETLPRTMLFVGEPGVGKSTIARQIAGKLKIPYTFVKCSLLANEYQNSGSQNIARQLDAVKETNKPSIVILDEINSIKKGDHQNDDENIATALIQKLDELENDPNVFIIGTANEIKNLPAHLISRFGEAIAEIEEPTDKSRSEFIKYYLMKTNCSYDAALVPFIANQTYYYSIRDISRIITRAGTCARCHYNLGQKKDGKISMSNQDITMALNCLKKSIQASGKRRLSPFQRKMKNLAENLSPYVYPSIAVIGLGLTAYGLYKSDFFNGKQLENATRQMQATQESLSMQRTSLELQTNALGLQQQALEMQSKSLELQGESVELQRESVELQKESLMEQMMAPVLGCAIGMAASACTIM